MTLEEYLAALSSLDDAPALMPPGELLGSVADKVDKIKTVVDRLEMEASRLDDYADKFKAASRACAAHAERLQEHVLHTMTTHGFEKLPGNAWRMQVQAAPVAVVESRPAGAEDMITAPDLVRRTVSYAWNKDAIKQKLLANEKIEGMSLRESKYVRFYVNKGSAK